MWAIDSRWSGQFGIGRYSDEILSRLTVPHYAIDLGGRPSNPFSALTGLREFTSEHDPLYSPGYAGIASRRHQVLTVHDLIHLHPSSKSTKYTAYYSLFLRPLIISNGTVITVSRTSRRLIEQWLATPAVEVINAGNGCSESFQAGGESVELGEEYVMFVGNPKPHKNFGLLLEAMTLLPELKLVVVGRGLHEKVHRYGDSRLIHRTLDITGLDDKELAAYYRGASVTALPSTVEGFGLPAIESMKCGTPVVYYIGCESVAEICDGRGFEFQRLERTALAEAIRRAVRSSDKFTLPSRDFTWDAVAETVNQALLAKQGRRR